MKRRDLIARLVEEGCVLVRTVGKHDFYRNVITDALQLYRQEGWWRISL